MAAATLFLASSEGCTATLHFDDVTLLSTMVVIDNTLGSNTVTFIMTFGTVLRKDVAPGQIANMVFPTAVQASRTVVPGKPGMPGFVLNGHVSTQIGVGIP